MKPRIASRTMKPESTSGETISRLVRRRKLEDEWNDEPPPARDAPRDPGIDAGAAGARCGGPARRSGPKAYGWRRVLPGRKRVAPRGPRAGRLWRPHSSFALRGGAFACELRRGPDCAGTALPGPRPRRRARRLRGRAPAQPREVARRQAGRLEPRGRAGERGPNLPRRPAAKNGRTRPVAHAGPSPAPLRDPRRVHLRPRRPPDLCCRLA